MRVRLLFVQNTETSREWLRLVEIKHDIERTYVLESTNTVSGIFRACSNHSLPQ
jgi:hypothetical protein